MAASVTARRAVVAASRDGVARVNVAGRGNAAACVCVITRGVAMRSRVAKTVGVRWAVVLCGGDRGRRDRGDSLWHLGLQPENQLQRQQYKQRELRRREFHGVGFCPAAYHEE